MSWRSSIYDNQTEILLWLKSRGHRVKMLSENDLTLPADRIRQRACSSKRPFQTAEDASAFAPHLRVYKCPHCDGYHLTTPRV